MKKKESGVKEESKLNEVPGRDLTGKAGLQKQQFLYIVSFIGKTRFSILKSRLK